MKWSDCRTPAARLTRPGSALGALAALALAALLPAAAAAADWSDTEVQYVTGSKFREPFNPGPANDTDVSRWILTLQHASGHKLGRNFFFVDMLTSTKGEPGNRKDGEVYGEWYSSLSLSKATGSKMEFGPIRDLNLTGGINYGAKSNGANPRVWLYGATVDFAVPGFIFLNVDFLRYDDRGHFNGVDQNNKATWQVSPAWLSKFSLGPTKWVFTGHVDFIGKRCDGALCDSEILAQPELKMDVGTFFGKPDTLFVGLEYNYWKSKFGFKGLDENNPQLQVAWKF